ncbi:MAG: hypothetical protein UV74_C0013G0386 [Candidatus Woesebacteria bacterium GW2011_GWB1_43_14]|uniref:Glycosyltransferase RgtA/B/C/D-like domain-containing protein n=1 Tax=Candidatus Woesebacteria bacterium GW2011_GWB1_43_14 TaxID=1618578 RepID=A0A0G1DHU6_9BACT|nr:MAG: hypothetical protein UT21_C0001G0097 [Candidatus Woesebacteria bacterium GW2011_GWA1_39_11b]KKS78318.1 MAG: hypothetical protein UV51_C0001G0034 [Candidatus Woesebacteria bacterium GW2011_GWC1_42_9]KKS97264.1 MAG: hypothetical protein UV74_C0013G0386 [Candidatus Woesebacteria bacterium GW2011_GWB1_43_14]
MSKNLRAVFFQNRAALILIAIGSLNLSLTMIKSGLVYDDFGMGFWGANGHDGVWHLALINHLSQGSLRLPIYYNENIVNYHIGFDLLLALIYKISTIPSPVLYFQIFPPVIAVALGISSYVFVYLWQKSKSAALWSTFFIYFGGSWGWIITLVRRQGFGGESMFWSQQSISTLINPPFALSLVMIFLGLIFFLKRRWMLSIIVFGVLIQIKSYAGVLCLGGLLLSAIFHYVKTKDSQLLIMFIGSLVVSILISFPLYNYSGGVFIYKPLWFLETMMGLSDRFGWARFGEAMVNYKYGGVWIKAFIAYLLAFCLFIVGNLGTRLIFLFKKWGTISYIDVFILTVIMGGIFTPMLFVQKGTAWNTIQFFYYSLVFVGVYAGISVNSIKNKYMGIFIILLTLPTTFGSLKHYLPGTPPAALPKEEIQALKFLAKEPEGVVLTFPYDRLSVKPESPIPLYRYESTGYVAAFSGKQLFLEDEMNLDIIGFDWRARREAVEEFYSSLDEEFVRNFLKDNDIDYVYWVDGQRATLGETQLGLERIFENARVDIYKVIK